jgi:hypothetical protein
MRNLPERLTERSTDGDIQRRVVRTAAAMDAAFPDAADLRLRPRIFTALDRWDSWGGTVDPEMLGQCAAKALES